MTYNKDLDRHVQWRVKRRTQPCRLLVSEPRSGTHYLRDLIHKNLGDVRYRHLSAWDLSMSVQYYGDLTAENIVFLSREDKIRQSLSFLRADQTDIWDLQEETEIPEATYDFSRILDLLIKYRCCFNTVKRALSETDVPVLFVSYEGLSENPENVIEAVSSFWGKPLLSEKVDSDTIYKKMADSHTETLYKRFIEALKLSESRHD